MSVNFYVSQRKVAPRVGAWIETLKKLYKLSVRKSHPVWVRGLKRQQETSASEEFASHPVWVRGLKPHLCSRPSNTAQSHPVWVRGLKQKWLQKLEQLGYVAPRVGAWIET